MPGLFRFPVNTENAEKWKEVLGMLDIKKEISGTVCMEHFSETDFRRKNRTELKANVIPRLLNTRTTQANISVEIETSILPYNENAKRKMSCDAGVDDLRDKRNLMNSLARLIVKLTYINDIVKI